MRGSWLRRDERGRACGRKLTKTRFIRCAKNASITVTLSCLSTASVAQHECPWQRRQKPRGGGRRGSSPFAAQKGL